MILCDISDAARYRAISPLFAEAVDWLLNNAGQEFVKGIWYINPEAATEAGVRVSCEEPALLPRDKARLEAHRRYIDIHVPLKGTETIGWAPVASLKHVHEPYDEARDIVFFGDTAQSLLHVKRGQIAVFFPEDAHAPNIGLGNHRKLCIKIPVE